MSASRDAVLLWLITGFILKQAIVMQKGDDRKRSRRWPLGELASGTSSAYDLGQVKPYLRLSFWATQWEGWVQFPG